MDEKLKLIAFYLPQYHPIPENDEWWGKGFTEWTNVTRAIPNFRGHYQPHLPSDFGFYDLRLPEIREAQAALAKQYGIYGFCYHHYWFGGKRLLERPFKEVLESGKPDFPFCLCWANENWTRRWDGAENQILMAQQHSPDDDLAFIRDIMPALKDPRYIRVNGKPLLIVYRVSLLPTPLQTAEIWQKEAYRNGIPGLYLVAAQSFGIGDPRPYGFDAAVEFPPHNARGTWINDQLEITNRDYQGNIFDYAKVAANHILQDLPIEKDYPLIHTVMPSWDNTARRQNHCHTFFNSSPEHYRVWLKSVVDHTRNKHDHALPFVFINAWNEWAEGCHLEPDQKYGHGFLEATRDALMNEPVMPPETITEKLTFVREQHHQKFLCRISQGQNITDELKQISNAFILLYTPENHSEVFDTALQTSKPFCIELSLAGIPNAEDMTISGIFNRLYCFIALSGYFHIHNRAVLFIADAGVAENAVQVISQLKEYARLQGTTLMTVWAVESEIRSGLIRKIHQDYHINHILYPCFDALAEIQPGNCLSVLHRMAVNDPGDEVILDTLPNLPLRHDKHFRGIYLPSDKISEPFRANAARIISQSIQQHQSYIILNPLHSALVHCIQELKTMTVQELDNIFRNYAEKHKRGHDLKQELEATGERYMAFYPEGKNTYNRIGIALRRLYAWGDRKNYRFVTGLFVVTGKTLSLCGMKKAGKDFLNMKKYI